MGTITTEYEGVYTETDLIDIVDFLCTMAEIAISPDDFVRKVAYGVTDETSNLSRKDEATLIQWYNKEYSKIRAELCSGEK